MVLQFCFLIAAGAVVGLILAKLARHLASRVRVRVTAEWIAGLSIDQYRPMMRLLGQEDLLFLRQQPGFTPQMEARFRIQRCSIFRAYLRDLNADFKGICTAIKVFMVQSNVDRPDIASALLRNQLSFAALKMKIQVQLVVFRFGLGAVDISGLVTLFDGMRIELGTLVPAESLAAA